jgi:hypothetical protein
VPHLLIIIQGAAFCSALLLLHGFDGARDDVAKTDCAFNKSFMRALLYIIIKKSVRIGEELLPV